MNLANKSILVTREASQAIEFNQKIKDASGNVLNAPLLKINPIKFESFNPTNYNWLFFTSANGVEKFINQLTNLAWLKTIKIAVVGHKTEDALKKHHLVADFIPTVYNAVEMAKEFTTKYPQANKILLVRGNLSRNVLPNFFQKMNIDYDTVVVYETVINKEIKPRLNWIFKTKQIDYITFMSPSTIDNFMTLLDEKYHNQALKIKVICIGTTTEKLALEKGFKHVSIPNQFTAESMLEKITEMEGMTKS